MHYDQCYRQEVIDKDTTDKKEGARQQIEEMLKEVLNDTMQVFDFGAKKHPDGSSIPNFLTINGNKCELKVRGKSVLGHAASSFTNPGALDEESGLPHLLHLISSAAILYIRHKRNIIHPSDKPKLNLGLCGWEYAGENNHRSNTNDDII